MMEAADSSKALIAMLDHITSKMRIMIRVTTMRTSDLTIFSLFWCIELYFRFTP
jgi:cytosine/uracil/thiamine/allantoin permease